MNKEIDNNSEGDNREGNRPFPPRRAKKIFTKIFLVIYVFLLTVIAARLFFEDQFAVFAELLKPSETQMETSGKVTIGYAYEPQSLNPLLFDAVTRSRLVDIYEGLVKTDRNLKIKPALALSWGLIDPVTWEFHLRPDVFFHNGQKVTPQDIVASLEKAQAENTSQLLNMLNTIENIQITGSSTIRIKTKNPDPLLLSKLAVTFVFPKDQQDFENPVGTGPYQFFSNQNGSMNLKYFQNYWGPKPAYQEVVLQTLPDRNDRVQALESGQVDFLMDVPAANVASLDQNKLQVQAIPSLEVNFLVFNLNTAPFSNKEVRSAINQVLDRQVFVTMADGFAHPSSQFVSNGVFGFNQKLSPSSYNLDEATKKVNSVLSSLERYSIVFDYPKGLDTAAKYIQEQLFELGIDLELNPLSGEELEQKISSGSSQLHYLGWRCELGDSQDFLQSIVHSRDAQGQYGQFNGSGYVNPNIDKMIEESGENLDIRARLEKLQEIMKIIVEDDVIGVPLFEGDVIFAYQKNIQFEPRVDGFVYASEIKKRF